MILPDLVRRLSRCRLRKLAAMGVLLSPAEPRPPDPLPDVREQRARALDEVSAARALIERAEPDRVRCIAQARALGCASNAVAGRLRISPQAVRKSDAWQAAAPAAEEAA